MDHVLVHHDTRCGRIWIKFLARSASLAALQSEAFQKVLREVRVQVMQNSYTARVYDMLWHLHYIDAVMNLQPMLQQLVYIKELCWAGRAVLLEPNGIHE